MRDLSWSYLSSKIFQAIKWAFKGVYALFIALISLLFQFFANIYNLTKKDIKEKQKRL